MQLLSCATRPSITREIHKIGIEASRLLNLSNEDRDKESVAIEIRKIKNKMQDLKIRYARVNQEYSTSNDRVQSYIWDVSKFKDIKIDGEFESQIEYLEIAGTYWDVNSLFQITDIFPGILKISLSDSRMLPGGDISALSPNLLKIDLVGSAYEFCHRSEVSQVNLILRLTDKKTRKDFRFLLRAKNRVI